MLGFQYFWRFFAIAKTGKSKTREIKVITKKVVTEKDEVRRLETTDSTFFSFESQSTHLGVRLKCQFISQMNYKPKVIRKEVLSKLSKAITKYILNHENY